MCKTHSRILKLHWHNGSNINDYGVETTGRSIYCSVYIIRICRVNFTLWGTPAFVDMYPDTNNVDPQQLELQIESVISQGKLTSLGIMPADLFVLAADDQEISEIADKYGLFVLEYAAQSFGAFCNGTRAYGLAEIGPTSFYPAKPIGYYGDSGAVLTNDSALYEELIPPRFHGQATSGDKYGNVRKGLNVRMDTIQAAVLLENLKLFEAEVELRNRAADRYSELLTDTTKTPHLPNGYSSAWAQYSVKSTKRQEIRAALQAEGIPTSALYLASVHMSTAYRHLNYEWGDLPVSEAGSKQIEPICGTIQSAI